MEVFMILQFNKIEKKKINFNKCRTNIKKYKNNYFYLNNSYFKYLII